MADLTTEDEAGRTRGVIIAGVDEVGRGPLAGPVVAAAVIWPADLPTHENIKIIRDSKKLSATQRKTLSAFIRAESIWSIATASVDEIDNMNILNASLLAMQRAVSALSVTPQHLLVDGNQRIKNCAIPMRCIVGGDNLSLSIAAASIIAKEYRDALMHALDKEYPAYGWASNAGYGTPAHLRALAQYGATPHHRRSFAPVRAVLSDQAA